MPFSLLHDLAGRDPYVTNELGQVHRIACRVDLFASRDLNPRAGMCAGVQKFVCQRRSLCSAWLPGGWHRQVVGHVEGQKGAAGQVGASVGKPCESERGLNVGDPGFRGHRILLKGTLVDLVHKNKSSCICASCPSLRYSLYFIVCGVRVLSRTHSGKVRAHKTTKRRDQSHLLKGSTNRTHSATGLPCPVLMLVSSSPWSTKLGQISRSQPPLEQFTSPPITYLPNSEPATKASQPIPALPIDLTPSPLNATLQ